MSTPVPIDSLTAAPLVIKGDVAVLEQLHFFSEHDAGLWVLAYDRKTTEGIVVGETVPAFRWYVPGAPETPDPTQPPTTYIPMLRFDHGVVLAAAQEYHEGATGPAANALRGGAIVE